MRREGLRRISRGCRSWRLIRISPLPSVRMRSGRRHILRIRLAVAAKSARGFQASFKRCEAAVCATFPAVIRAPRIVLSLGAGANSQDTDTNSQDEQREPHGRLLIMAPPINAHRRG